MSTFKWLVVAMVLCSAVSLSRAVDPLYIDNFSDGNPDLTKWNAGFAETTEVGLFEVMGGERYSKIQIVGLTTSSASIRIQDAGDQLLLSSDAGVVAEWTLIYGKNNDLNQDFFPGQFDDTVHVDWAGWTDDQADVTVILMSGSGAQEAQVTKATVGGAAAQMMDFTFAEFLLDNPLIDFDSIDRVTLFIEGRPNWDGTLQAASISIPEPATMSLLCIGGLAMLRRKRQK